SEGLILLTDDGVVAKAYLTHPHKRVYHLWIDAPLTPSQKERLESGMMLFGKRTQPLHITIQSPMHLIWEMEEGKNRQIRRMIQKVGRSVYRLKRVTFGGLSLSQLRPGKFRVIDH
ncbi:MAG: rRNA pseudouridine synthase, partial [Candidatus Margulisbacteria bacterium]|nr:rRNA pseudouridine synthase [Candidatus Margulisiibacteriota bacterium]